MPRAYPLQPSLNAGEFSPRMAARTDFAKYPLACATLENMLPLPQGGAARRPGTRFVAAVKDHARKVKLRAFEFSTIQAYVLECGHEYIRFYKDRGRIVAAATDAVVANGGFDAGISGWTDISTGAGAIAHDAANGRLNLVGGASGEAAAEQAVTTTATGQEHVVRFRVPGLAGQSAILRIGTSSGGAEVLAARDCATGWHAVAFTPTASPFYLQFANAANTTMQIDDVALISDAPVEIGAPWQEGELHTVKQAQSADVLYLTHPDRPVHKLSRTGHASWSLVEVFAEDGPYLRQNATATMLTPSAVTGNGITISASATAGINGGAGFTDGDVGRLVRISNPASGTRWGYAVITGRSSATQVTAEVKRGFATANATADWRLGAWCGNCGWPAAVTFQEQRLCFAGTREQPQTFWMSQSADFENMTPDSANESGAWDGTLEDDDALDFTISADQVNAIRWIAPGKKLFVGMIGGEWAVSSESAAITPTDVDVKRQTAFGVADLPPVQMRSRMTFVQRAGRKVMEFSFDLEQDNFHALDMTVLSDHVTEGGIVDLAYQQEPDSTLWTVRADGQLPTLTYQPDQNVIGWARCRLGGAFGGLPHARCETVAVIPAEGRDETWVCAARIVGGATRRYVEVFDPPYQSGDAQANACYADSALVYEGAPATDIVGLDHLEGEMVAVLADGAVHPPKTVSGGGIVLDYPASKAVCGLPYTHAYESLKWEAGAAGGTAQGQIKRIHGVTLVLLDSIGGAIGPDAAHMKAMPFRATGDAMDVAVPLFTGEKYVSFDGDFATDTRVRIEGADPAPFTLLAVAPEIKTNAR